MSPVPSEKGFQLFPNFPAEIRLKIWEFYTWYPRVVEIRTYDHPSNIGFWTNDQGNSVSDLRWVTKTPPPPALSVCRELRVEAKKIWSFRFQLHPGGGGEIIHINPILDTIYTHVGRWPELIPSLLRDLQSFSTPQCRILHFACNIHSFPYIPGIAPMLANLDTLLCVVDPQRGTYNWFDEWKDSNCIFVAAQTNKEFLAWEKGAGTYWNIVMKLRSLIAPLPAIHLVVIRWGNDADKTSDDEKKFPVLQGPMRMDLLRFE